MSETTPVVADRRPLWRRVARLVRRTIVLLVGLAIIARIALPFVLPSVLDSVASGYGLSADYEALDLSILGGEVTLRRLSIAARTAAEAAAPEPYVQLEYALVDLDVSALWGGTLRVHRVEVDGLDLLVERRADGSLALADHAPRPADPPMAVAPATDQAAEATAPTPLDLSIPVWVDAVRAQHVRLRVVDRAVTPNVETWVETNVRISDLGCPDRAARIEVIAQGPDLLDRFAALGTLEARNDRLIARLDVALEGAHLKPVAQWLAELGITPSAESIDAHALLSLEATVAPERPTEVTAALRLDGLRLRADRDEAFAIDEVRVDVQRAGARTLDVPTVAIRGLRGAAATRPDGALAVAGIELRPSPAANTAAPSDPDSAPAASPAATPTGPGKTLALASLRIEDVALRFTDGSFEPAVPIEFALDAFELRDLVADPARPDAVATLELSARAPGIAESLQVSATFAPFAIRKSLHAEVALQRITFARIEPYLTRLGLAATLAEGSCTLQIDANAHGDTDGATRAELAIEDLRFADREAILFRIARVSTEGILIDPVRGRVRIGEVMIRGTEVPLRRDAERALHFVGLRTLPTAAATPPAPGVEIAARPRTGAAAPTRSGMRFELGALRIRDTALTWIDEVPDPAVRATTSALEADIENLFFGGSPNDPSPGDANVRLRLRVDGVAEELGLRGTITSHPGPLDVTAQLQLVGDRLATGAFAPYLQDLGIESTLEAGRLRATLAASAKELDGGVLRATAQLQDFVFQDGDQEPFVTIGSAGIDEVLLDADGVHVGTVLIDEPRLRAELAADGALLALGLRIAPPPPLDGKATELPAATTQQPSAPTEPTTAATTPTGFSLTRLEIRKAALGWRDATVAETAAIDVGVDLAVDAVTLGSGGEPARFSIETRVADAVGRASIRGTFALDPNDLRLDAGIDAEGLQGGPLERFLPPGSTSTLRDGRFRAHLDARLATLAEGGIAVAMNLVDVDLRDGPDGDPLLSCDAVRIDAPRIDAAGKLIAVKEVTVRGATLRARRTAEGATELLGLAFAPPAAPANPAAVDTGPAVEPPADATGAAAATTVDRREAPPRVVIESFDIELARFRFEDATEGGSAPPIDAAIRLHAPGPLVLLDAVPEALGPIELKVDAAIAPLLDTATFSLKALPWQADPTIVAAFDVRGLHGGPIAEVLPSLRDQVDGAGLTDGRLSGRVSIELALRRRTMTDIDLSRGLGVEVQVEDLEFRASEDGEILAGIRTIELVAPRIVPGGDVLITSLDIEGIRGRVARTPDGLQVLGLTIKTPPAAPAADGASTEPVAVATQVPAESTTPAKRGPEFRLDEFSVRGIDFVFDDSSVDPPMVVPLNGLDLEVDGFTTRAFTEARPIRFALALTGGEVDLPKVQAASSAIAGLLGAAVNVVTGTGDAVELEKRPFLDEFAMNGRLTLYPAPEGRIRTNVSALELNTFRGIAKQSGVEIGDGVLDVGSDINFLGSRGATVDTRLTFERLVLSEPPGGPISTYLKLPAPLNTVLFALRDDADRIEIPLAFDIDSSSGLSSSQIASQAITALGVVLAKAVTSAPLRVTGMVTGALGIGGLFSGDETPLADQSVTVKFTPAAVTLPGSERASLSSISDLLRGDADLGVLLVHAFGQADYDQASRLANPSEAQTRAVVERLRQRRAELNRSRAEGGAEARSMIATGRQADAKSAVARLQGLDREIGEVEQALDKALELLRPGAERRADRRARTAALQIGNRRIETVVEELIRHGGETLRDRIEVRRARINAPDGDSPGSVTAIPKRRKQG